MTRYALMAIGFSCIVFAPMIQKRPVVTAAFVLASPLYFIAAALESKR